MRQMNPTRRTTTKPCQHCGDTYGDCQCWHAREPVVCPASMLEPSDLRTDRPIILLAGECFDPGPKLEALIMRAIAEWQTPEARERIASELVLRSPVAAKPTREGMQYVAGEIRRAAAALAG